MVALSRGLRRRGVGRFAFHCSNVCVESIKIGNWASPLNKASSGRRHHCWPLRMRHFDTLVSNQIRFLPETAKSHLGTVIRASRLSIGA